MRSKALSWVIVFIKSRSLFSQRIERMQNPSVGGTLGLCSRLSWCILQTGGYCCERQNAVLAQAALPVLTKSLTPSWGPPFSRPHLISTISKWPTLYELRTKFLTFRFATPIQTTTWPCNPKGKSSLTKLCLL